MQTVPYIFGIAHPTGFPLFTLLGGIFSHVVPFGTVAWRLSLFCALAMSLAAVATYLLACELGAEPRIAVAGAWLFAAGEAAWTHGTRAEVHALAPALALLAITCAVRFYRTSDPRALWRCALWLGLGLADHPVVALIIPGAALLVLRHPKIVLGACGLRACAIVFACLSCYLYLPLRSAYVFAHRADPTLSLGIPPGRPYWDYGHPVTWTAFKREVLGEDFHAGHALVEALHPKRFAEVAVAYGARAAKEVSWYAFLGAAVGALSLACIDPPLGLGVLLAGLPAVPFVYVYKAESDTDRYLLVSYAVIAAFAAVGVSRCSCLLPSRGRMAALGAALLLLAFPAAQAVGANRATVLLKHRMINARDWVERVRAETLANAVIIADWTSATPLAYASYVEGSLEQRIVETAWIEDDRSHVERWMRVYPVYVASVVPPFLPGYAFDVIDSRYPPLYRMRIAP
jgi:hypothetical protein